MGKTSYFNKLRLGTCTEHLPKVLQSWNYVPGNPLLSSFFSQPQRKKINLCTERIANYDDKKGSDRVGNFGKIHPRNSKVSNAKPEPGCLDAGSSCLPVPWQNCSRLAPNSSQWTRLSEQHTAKAKKERAGTLDAVPSARSL